VHNTERSLVSYHCSESSYPEKDKTDSMKDRFYEEVERVFDKFIKYHNENYSSAKVGKEDVLKTMVNESLNEISNGNGISVVNFATYKNLTYKVPTSQPL
jgi:hypothetical protein